MELIDVSVLHLYNTVLWKMEELILCESLGMWSYYAYTGSVGCVFETESIYSYMFAYF